MENDDSAPRKRAHEGKLVTDEPVTFEGSTPNGVERNDNTSWQFWTAIIILAVAIALAFTSWGGAAILLVLLAGVVLADKVLR